MNGKGLEKLIDHTPVVCSKCGGALDYEGAGEYKCRSCNNIDLDDYGIVRKYIEDNGPAPFHVIKKATGVDGQLIKGYLADPTDNNKDFRSKCRRCNCVIKQGDLCSACRVALEPKKTDNIAVSKRTGDSMRFLNDRWK